MSQRYIDPSYQQGESLRSLSEAEQRELQRQNDLAKKANQERREAEREVERLRAEARRDAEWTEIRAEKLRQWLAAGGTAEEFEGSWQSIKRGIIKSRMNDLLDRKRKDPMYSF